MSYCSRHTEEPYGHPIHCPTCRALNDLMAQCAEIERLEQVRWAAQCLLNEPLTSIERITARNRLEAALDTLPQAEGEKE